MSNYTKSTNFATKDNLSPGDPLKIVRGTEIDTEFNNISTAISTKTDNSAAAITGGSITGITDLAIADGGTGASTATAALNNLLPSQTGNSSKYLQTDGTNATWDAISINTGDITGTLPVANGGTGITSFGTGIATFLGTPSSANLASAVTDETGSGALVFANTPTLVAPILGTPTSGNFSSGSFTWPTFNQNTTGTAAGLSATLAIASGGTGQTTANAAFNALAPSQTSASGKYLKSDGTNTSWDALDISTADITGTLPVANGGTGITSFGTGIATFLETPSSANLRSALTDDTGTGSAVFATSPTLVTPILGTPQSGNFSTGTFTWPTFNQNTTGTAAGLSATLATTSGGTGLTSFTSGGVVYASSSSALATGSGLTFGATGNLGIGTAGETMRLAMRGDVSASTYPIVKGRIDAPFTGGWDTLAPGTTLGGFQLFTYRTDTFDQNKSSAVEVYLANNSFGAGRTGMRFITGGYNNTDGVEAMRITEASNVGIGTSSPQGKLQVGSPNTSGSITIPNCTIDAQSIISGSSNSPVLSFNAYNSSYGMDLWVGTTGLSPGYIDIRQNESLIFRRNTASGTATETMRLDSAGSLLVGTTTAPTVGALSRSIVSIKQLNDTYLTSGIQIEANANTNVLGIGYNGSTFAIGTTYRSTGGYVPISFSTSDVERVRITSAGNLAVGKTVAEESQASGSGYGFNVDGGNGPYFSIVQTSSSTGNACIYLNRKASSGSMQVFQYDNTVVGSISHTSSVTLYNTTSDQRLKENIVDAPDFGSVIDSIQVRSFDWKANNEHQRAGFIAQELVTVAPEAVHQPTDTDEMMAVDYSKLVPMLVKEIQSLRQRVAQLETN